MSGVTDPITRLNDTHRRIAEVLRGKTLTAAEIAGLIGTTYIGAVSCLRGMKNRRQVVTLKPKDASKPYRYRLREVAA